MTPQAISSILLLLSSASTIPAPDITLPARLVISITQKGILDVAGKIKVQRDRLVTSLRENRYYNPGFGYEPYWAKGSHVIRDPAKDLEPGATTEQIPLVCGEECSYIYRSIKQVCAHQPKKHYVPDCPLKYATCRGKVLTDLSINYETFDTYCAFLDAQCRADEYKYGRYDLLHRGPCEKPMSKYIKQIGFAKDLLIRKKKFLGTWKNRLQNMTTTQVNWPQISLSQAVRY